MVVRRLGTYIIYNVGWPGVNTVYRCLCFPPLMDVIIICTFHGDWTYPN